MATDEKLWRGLESKFSPTKALCDQISETLQHLAAQVQEGIKKRLMILRISFSILDIFHVSHC